MKVLFLNPAERLVLRSNLPQSIEELRGKNPPISILYAAGVARQVEGWETELIDIHATDLDDDALARELVSRKPDLVGITSTTFTYLDSLAAARVVKKALPACAVLFGGVQPFVFPRETLAQAEVDMVLSGEAEQSLPRLLAGWRDGGFDSIRAGAVPGVLVKGDSDPAFEPAPIVLDLDGAPMPAWDLAPLTRYTSLITDRAPVNIMITSRGCPYHCGYCALSPTGKKWRAHSAKRVVEEMKTCRALGSRYLLFYDESFTVNKRRVLDICERIRREGIDIPWMARATPEMADGSVLRAMREAGCDLVTFGVESGSPEILDRLGRRQDLEQVRETFREAQRTGLRTIAYFMLGNPGETKRHITESLRVATRLNPDLVHAALYTPYPSSRLYLESLEGKGADADYWRRFAEKPDESFQPPYGNGFFSDSELERLLGWFYRRYSFRPRYVLRRILSLKGPADLVQAWRGMWTLLTGFAPTDGSDHAG